MAAVRPSLDVLCRNPAAASGLDRATLIELLAELNVAQAELNVAQGAITAALLACSATPPERPAAANANGASPLSLVKPGDRVITIAQATKILHRTERWFYRNRAKLPFIHPAGPRSYLIDEAEMREWLRAQRAKE